jgi:hypothetical protein
MQGKPVDAGLPPPEKLGECRFVARQGSPEQILINGFRKSHRPSVSTSVPSVRM